MEMPMMPTQPSAAPATMAESAVEADAPEGAFEEMLARRLGRQLVGRFARDHGDGADSGVDGEPVPWMPPNATAGTGEAPPVVSPPADPATMEPGLERPPTARIVGAPEPMPVRISVNRPGFPAPMAEPGIIQPGPSGEVWTHPSGFADLQLTRHSSSSPGNASVGGVRSPVPELTPTGPAEASTLAPATPGTTEVPEPPEVRWSPAPARAALAAAANRDLELEIVTKLAQSTSQPTAGAPRLRIVDSAGAEPTAPVPPAVVMDVSSTNLDPTGVNSAANPIANAPTNVPNSSLVERVIQAVEMQQHLPPPRAIAIEIPEIEGLRLLVTMRMDGSVHVASSGTTLQAANDHVTPLLQAVNEALAERGFDMSADTGGRQSAHPDANDEPVPPRTPRFRRSARRSGLRI